MNAAITLFDQAFRVTLMLTIPVIAVVGCAGICMGLLQTLVQVQDQNVSFGPKIAALALLTSLAGMTALTLLQSLFQSVVNMLPLLARS